MHPIARRHLRQALGLLLGQGGAVGNGHQAHAGAVQGAAGAVQGGIHLGGLPAHRVDIAVLVGELGGPHPHALHGVVGLLQEEQLVFYGIGEAGLSLLAQNQSEGR